MLSTALLPSAFLVKQAPQAMPQAAHPMAQSVANISQGLQLMQEADSNGAPPWPVFEVTFVMYACHSPRKAP